MSDSSVPAQLNPFASALSVKPNPFGAPFSNTCPKKCIRKPVAPTVPLGSPSAPTAPTVPSVPSVPTVPTVPTAPTAPLESKKRKDPSENEQEPEEQDEPEEHPAKKCMTQLRELVALRQDHEKLLKEHAALQKEQAEAKKREEAAKQREEEAKKHAAEQEALEQLQRVYMRSYEHTMSSLLKMPMTNHIAIQCMTTHKVRGEYWIMCESSALHYLVITNLRVFRFQQVGGGNWAIMPLYTFRTTLSVKEIELIHSNHVLESICVRIMAAMPNAPSTVDAERFESIVRLIPGSYVSPREGWKPLGGFFGIYHHPELNRLSSLPSAIVFEQK